MDYGTEYDKNYYSDSGDMDYSNNGYDTSGILNASSNSISIELSPGNAASRENNASDSYGYVSIIHPVRVSINTYPIITNNNNNKNVLL